MVVVMASVSPLQDRSDALVTRREWDERKGPPIDTCVHAESIYACAYVCGCISCPRNTALVSRAPRNAEIKARNCVIILGRTQFRNVRVYSAARLPWMRGETMRKETVWLSARRGSIRPGSFWNLDSARRRVRRISVSATRMRTLERGQALT